MTPDDRAKSRPAAAAQVSEIDKGVLRFLTCGSVDDGKSTLIGRLLWDSEAVLDDQRAQVESESAGRMQDGDIDFSLLVDGLTAEREQGITIDVAYRFFQTRTRRFVIADTPGHVQYTRNMAMAASNADLAVVLVDARHGILTQTHRHLTIARMMGIRHVTMIVNKMDLIAWDEARFRALEAEATSLVQATGVDGFVVIPVSALRGDNVYRRSETMDWYQGPTVIEHLNAVDCRLVEAHGFRLPVQWVNRPNSDFRGYSGTLRGGTLRRGDAIQVWPSGTEASVERIVTFDGDLAEASIGDAVTFTLDREVDVSRGDMIAAAGAPMVVANQFQARLIWIGGDKLVPGRSHLVQFEAAATAGQIMAVKYRVDVNTGAHLEAKTLECNDIGVVTVELDRNMPFDCYAENRHTGSFILVDRYTNATIAAGLIEYPLRRATNVVWHDLSVDKALRASQKNQRPACVWFTGLSGSGKSTIANMLDRRLAADDRHTYVLDGDNVRHGLNHDLGFTEADRVENIRRMAEVAKLMVDAGLIVMVCAISPYRRDREMARALFEDGEFIEVFVDTPLAECETRDPKGLYAKARQGQIPNFTGISAPYEPPPSPEVHLDGTQTQEALAEQVFDYFERKTG
jgi:bifunctional enzyme CysN/CysC